MDEVKSFKLQIPDTKVFPHRSFYLVRHGETDWNKEEKVMGQTNIPLNNNGILQAQAIAEKIESLPIDIIISSPLERAKETAEIISAKINKKIIIESNLQECSWGIMEGKIKKTCDYNQIPFEPEIWWQQGIVPENAESFSEFSYRVNKSIKNHLMTQNNILFVAHGGVIMSVLAYLDNPSWDIKNTALYHFTPPAGEQDSWSIHLIK